MSQEFLVKMQNINMEDSMQTEHTSTSTGTPGPPNTTPNAKVCFDHSCHVTIAGFLQTKPTFSINSNGTVSMSMKPSVKSTIYYAAVYDYAFMLKLTQSAPFIREVQVVGPLSAYCGENRYTNRREMYLRVTIKELTFVTNNYEIAKVDPPIGLMKEAYRYSIMKFIEKEWCTQGLVYKNQIEYSTFFEKLSKLHDELYPTKAPLKKQTLQDPVDVELEKKRKIGDLTNNLNTETTIASFEELDAIGRTINP